MLRKGTLSTALGLGVCVFAPLSQADLTAANKALPSMQQHSHPLHLVSIGN